MKRLHKILILALAALFAGGPCGAQTPYDGVLAQVEANNASLVARRSLTDAQRLEARAGNSLENPEVEYEHMWGNRSELGKEGELSVMQGFDFPSLYSNRSKLARAEGEVYDHQYAAFRQDVLLEALSLCIEITALRERGRVLEAALENAERVAGIYDRRLEAGDANILDVNKSRFEMTSARNARNSNLIELETAENRLANLNGGIPVTVPEAGMDAPVMLPPQGDIERQYEQMSPEMLAAEGEKTAADYGVKVSRGQSMPRFSLGYKFTHAGREKFNGIAVGMSIPMFGNRHNVKRAKAQALYAEAEVNRTRVDIRTEIGRMYAHAGLLKATIDEYEAAADHAEAERLLGKALDAGHISLTDYFTELGTIYGNRLEIIDLRRDYLLVCAQINRIGL